MAKLELSTEKSQYYSVLADGKFHHSVPEGTPGAVKREYETSDGKVGVKYDIIAESIAGKIEAITIREGEYGKQLQVVFAGDGSDDPAVTVSLNLSSKFAEDLLKKLPNIKTDEEVKLVPYAFEDAGKKKAGITVYQSGEKVSGYYHEMVKKGKKEVLSPKNGYPEVPEESSKWDSDDWKIFFTQARKFLVSELEKNPIYRDASKVTTGELDPTKAGMDWEEIGSNNA